MTAGDLSDAANGIYANPGQDERAWERPRRSSSSTPTAPAGYQSNAGIRIRGGFSRSTATPSTGSACSSASEYGDSKFDFPMFGPTGADEFDKFDLRTGNNYSWSFDGRRPVHLALRDVFSRDTQLAMGQPTRAADYYHLYLNGQYWGIYNTESGPTPTTAQPTSAATTDDYDVVKVDPALTTSRPPTATSTPGTTSGEH